MFILDAIFAVILAIAFGLLLSVGLGVRGPWAAPWALFLLLFLFIWAGGIWATPIGPVAYGVYWMPFVVIGLFLALLIAAGSEPQTRRRRVEEPADTHRVEEGVAALGLTAFFWVLIGGLVLAISAGYR